MQDKNDVLKRFFGFDSFRQGQEKLVDSILEGKDAVGIMPTGAGKSICFQVPAMIYEGITIVVSPLVSLMKDQVMGLVSSGVPAAFFNSMLNERQYLKALKNAKNGFYKIIYVAPERLLTQRFQEFVQSVEISVVAIDEAHCVSGWGQDFRPSYLEISKFIETLKQRPVVCAFTATATENVKNDIVKLLGIKNPVMVTTGFDRKNLYFEVQQNKDKKTQLLEVLRKNKGESGIVYCSTRKKVEEVYDFLKGIGIGVTRYHAGLSLKERNENQEDFLFDRKSIMVATNAFGMGIDKSDVRFIVHFNMPKDMESYYQEAGRAGRDNEEASCIMLYNKQDVEIAKFMIANGKDKLDIDEEERSRLIECDLERLKKMVFYCTTHDCLRHYMLEYFGEKGEKKCSNCSGCIRTEKEIFISRIKPQVNSELYEELKKLRKEIAQERGVPAFVIFSDKVLKEICTVMPKSERELLSVSGVGREKAERYGRKIIEAIEDYFNEFS